MCGLRATSISKLPEILLMGSDVLWIYSGVQKLLDLSDCSERAVVIFRVVLFEDVNNMLLFFSTLMVVRRDLFRTIYQ